MSPVKLLCIGHCCHDVTRNGYILGGSASYTSLIGRRLGADVKLITSVGDDFGFLDHFFHNGIEVQNQCAQHTTLFHNKYSDQKRTQYLLKRAEDIDLSDYREVKDLADIILIGSIADEIDLGQIKRKPHGLIAGVIQGNLRRWNEGGLIIPKEIDFSLLSNFDIVYLSEEDIDFISDGLSKILSHVSHLVITRGQSESSVFINGAEYRFPTYPTQVQDTTGAGDTFAIAYTLKYHKTRDITKSAIYAHCASSIIIEHDGLQYIPDESEIFERVRLYHHILDQ